jgi:hypothetical protein
MRSRSPERLEDRARRAAEVVAGYENRFSRVETDLTVLKWMVGFNLALSIGILTHLLQNQSAPATRGRRPERSPPDGPGNQAIFAPAMG